MSNAQGSRTKAAKSTKHNGKANGHANGAAEPMAAIRSLFGEAKLSDEDAGREMARLIHEQANALAGKISYDEAIKRAYNDGVKFGMATAVDDSADETPSSAPELSPHQIAQAAHFVGLSYVQMKVLVARRVELLRLAELHTVGEPQLFPDDPRRIYTWSNVDETADELGEQMGQARVAMMGLLSREQRDDTWQAYLAQLHDAFEVAEMRSRDLRCMARKHDEFQREHPELFPMVEVGAADAQ